MRESPWRGCEGGVVKRLLFVCLGNICRSPAAHGISEFLIAKHRLGEVVSVDSAGTANYQVGRPADARMQLAAGKRGYELRSLAKQLTPSMVAAHDVVIAMDRENYRDIFDIVRGEPSHVRMLSDYLDVSWPRDVPDPYYGGPEGFDYVLDMLEAACPSLLVDVLGRPLNPP